ncbi:MAG: transcription termination/antitermination protein NusG [Treponema sp.]|jgi:transcriptional antiterminator NusG|nr:transcription termination/antitermination protein NusG [Treponema sp.]
MATGWYVLHIYSGYENKIEKTIRMMIEMGELDKEVVRDIKIPAEEVVEVKDGKKRTLTKKFLPGYILIEMDLPDADMGWKIPCSKIKKIQGVTGFVGTQTGRKPQPISSDEARAILQKSGEIKGERPVRSRQTFSVGEQVKFVGGPFESFSGTIDEVYAEKNKLKVMVEIFGRKAPVEVDLLQVEKI